MPAATPLDRLECPPAPEWVGLGEIGACFGWDAGSTGWALTRLRLRRRRIPVERAVQVGLARRGTHGRWAWDKSKLVPLLEYLGCTRLSPIEEQAWRAASDFFCCLRKATAQEEANQPGYTTSILNGVEGLWNAVPRNEPERTQMILALHDHLQYTSLLDDFRTLLLGAMYGGGEAGKAELEAQVMARQAPGATHGAIARRL